MNSKTLSIYAAIMAVALVAGIASTTVGTVYAHGGGGDKIKIKTHLENEDCEEAFCANLGINLVNSPIVIVPP